MAVIESISDQAADKIGAAVARYLVAQAKSEHLIVHAAIESVSDKAATKLGAAVKK